MKKIIIIILVAFFITSGFLIFNISSKEKSTNTDKTKITENKQNSKDEKKEEQNESDNQEVEESEVKQEQKDNKQNNQNIENKSSNTSNNSTNNNSSKVSSSKVESSNSSSTQSSNNNSNSNNSQVTVDDGNSVDTTHPDYHIHKGKKDCIESSSCMDISLPIQFKYKKSIDNTFYVEVKAKNGTVLGYFIEYVFKKYKYANDEECNQIGNEIKSKLSDRVTSYSCNSGTLKIKTNY